MPESLKSFVKDNDNGVMHPTGGSARKTQNQNHARLIFRLVDATTTDGSNSDGPRDSDTGSPLPSCRTEPFRGVVKTWNGKGRHRASPVCGPLLCGSCTLLTRLVRVLGHRKSDFHSIPPHLPPAYQCTMIRLMPSLYS